MSPVVNDMIMSLVRKGLVALGTWLVSKGVFEHAEWETYTAGLTIAIVGAGWSLWNKWQAQPQPPTE
jgi:hypothetical protein